MGLKQKPNYDINSLFERNTPQSIDLPDFLGNTPSSVNQFTDGVSGERIVDGNIGGILQSSNFKTGSAGWQIKPDGTAEFQTIIAGAYIQVFVQTTPPTSLHINDIWYDSDDDNHPYRAECVGANEITAGEWVSIRDAGAGGTQTTIFYEATAPASGMITDDYWIDSDDNKIYRYDGANWGEVQDTDIATAISNAATAQSTADGKVYIYKQDEEPTGQVAGDIGDLWIDTNDKNKLYRYSGSAWEEVRDTDIAQAITNAATAQSSADTAQATADGKVVTFYQDAEPTAEGVGDLWVDTNDGNKLYRWSGSAWTSVVDADIATAIANASTAQATADGKIVTFYQDTEPTADGTGDIWIDTNDNNKPYRWSGSVWEAMNNPTDWADVLDGATTKPANNADVTSANNQLVTWLTSNMRIDTIFETAGRFYTTVGGSGSAVFGNNGAMLQPGATATSYARMLLLATNYIFYSEPVFSCVLTVFNIGTLNGRFAVGLGQLTVDGNGFTELDGHNFCGFYLKKVNGAVTLALFQQKSDNTYSYQNDITSISNSTVLELFMKIKSTGVTYYYRKNGGALTTITTKTTGNPYGQVDEYIYFANSNRGSASNFQILLKSASYEK